MKPFVADRLHAGGALVASARRTGTSGSPATTTTTSTRAGRIRRRTTPSGASSSISGRVTSVQKYGRARGRELVVGSLERAGHRLLARHARRVHEAVRLRGRRTEARAADRAHRRARSHRPERRAHAADSAQLHRALPARHELRDRQDRIAARSRDVPREGRADGAARRPRAHERQQPAPRHRQRLHHRRVVPGARRTRRS